jgi:hypothetical protein
MPARSKSVLQPTPTTPLRPKKSGAGLPPTKAFPID